MILDTIVKVVGKRKREKIKVACPNCRKLIVCSPSAFKARQADTSGKPICCSRTCSDAMRARRIHEAISQPEASEG